MNKPTVTHWLQILEQPWLPGLEFKYVYKVGSILGLKPSKVVVGPNRTVQCSHCKPLFLLSDAVVSSCGHDNNRSSTNNHRKSGFVDLSISRPTEKWQPFPGSSFSNVRIRCRSLSYIVANWVSLSCGLLVKKASNSAERNCYLSQFFYIL